MSLTKGARKHRDCEFILSPYICSWRPTFVRTDTQQLQYPIMIRHMNGVEH